jgi:hypothetical protein
LPDRGAILVLAALLLPSGCTGVIEGAASATDANVVETRPDSSTPDASPPPARDADVDVPDGAPPDVDATTDAFDSAPPPPRVGHLAWLLDGETSGWQPSDTPHDGANRTGCLGRRPEAATISADHPAYRGEYAVELRLSRTWPWGEDGCNGSPTHPKILVLSGNVAPLPRDEEVWIGWAVYLPDDWEGGQDFQVAQMHRGGYGPFYWIEVSADLEWRLSARDPIPALHDVPIHIATATRGRWHSFVTHSVLSQDPTLGSITVWERLDGEREWTLAVEYEGATAVPDSALTYSAFPADAMFSIEPVRTRWDDGATTQHLYLDEIRVGGPESSFDEVAPGSNVILE